MADYQINNAEIYDLIRYKYIEIYDRALRAELPVDNIQIRLRSNLKEALEMGDTLLVGFGAFNCNAPVVADDTIKEIKTSEGLRSNILIYDPDWLEDTGA